MLIVCPSFRSYSWGYKRAFEEYSNILREKYPGLTIIGDNFPPPASKHYFALCFNVAKLLTIALVVINVDPFALLGMETPAFWFWLASNRIFGCLITFFVSNVIEGQLISTGAFEISYNGRLCRLLNLSPVLTSNLLSKDVPVWSKLETGRIPSPPELFQIIDNRNLNFKTDMNSYKF